jgi:UDP:flavonoid glycosyltransferase YjiC (YdhE family)
MPRCGCCFRLPQGPVIFGPLIPFAKACRDPGHEVKVAAPASFAAAIIGAGFDRAPFADVPPEVMSPIFGRLPNMSFEEANKTVLAEVFSRLDAQAALPALADVIDGWHPDIVVRDPCEFASLVAAERAGVPQVQVAIGMGGSAGFALPILAAPLAELSVIAGLPEDRAMQTLLGTPGFTCVPAELDGLDGQELSDAYSVDAGAPVWRFQDASLTAGPGSLPPRWGDPDAPLVYVTFGSVTAGLGRFAAVYPATLEAFADMPVRVLMTTGDGVDPTSLEPLPANAHVERWWPQVDVMPHAAVVVGHGGFGTTMQALAAGVPQVVVPLFAFDQTINADRVAAIGAGIHLPGGPAASAAIPDAVTSVLTDPKYREFARRVAADMARLPDVATSVPILEELASR